MALFFDELSSVFLQRNDDRENKKINKPFLIWLLNLITEYFESNFVVEEPPETTSNFNLQIMRSLNDVIVQEPEGEEVAIAINIAGALLNANPK